MRRSQGRDISPMMVKVARLSEPRCEPIPKAVSVAAIWIAGHIDAANHRLASRRVDVVAGIIKQRAGVQQGEAIGGSEKAGI